MEGELFAESIGSLAELLERIPPESPSAPAFPESPKTRKALSKARRELTEEELQSPAGVRFLIDSVDRLESEVAELSEFRKQYYRQKEKAAVLETEKNARMVFGWLESVCIAVGAALIGLTPYLYRPGDEIIATLVGLLAAGLIIASVVIRALKR